MRPRLPPRASSSHLLIPWMLSPSTLFLQTTWRSRRPALSLEPLPRRRDCGSNPQSGHRSDVSEPLPGTNQYPAEDYFPVGARVARTLRDASPNTYFIVLTNRDINSNTRNFRFQYSMHSPAVNTSVLSFARLLYNVDGSKATENVAAERVTKMLMRIVGEMRLGWKRTSDPKSLMYAPVMSVEDIDRTSLSYTMKSHEAGK